MITRVGSRVRDLVPTKGHQGILGGDRTVLYFDYDSDHTLTTTHRTVH